MIAYGIAFFFVSLVYALNLYMPVAGIVAPRHGFVASAGFCILLGAILLTVSQYLADKRVLVRWNYHKISIAFTVCFILGYLPFTVQRNKAWKDIFQLIEADIGHLDRSFEAQRIAAGTYYSYIQKSDSTKMNVDMLQKSYQHAKLGHEVYSNDRLNEQIIGYTAYHLGKKQEAHDQMINVLEVFGDIEIEKHRLTYQVLADVYFDSRNYREAARYYALIGKILPNKHAPFKRYTESMVAAGAYDEAIAYNKDQIRRNPHTYYHYEDVGFIYLSKGDTLNASGYIIHAVYRKSPRRHYMALIRAYYKRQGLDDQWAQFEAGVMPELN